MDKILSQLNRNDKSIPKLPDRRPRFLEILDSSWYRLLVRLQSSISFATFQFFSLRGIEATHLPITTSCLSSPMGLGSDSLGVSIDLFGIPTFLADSMQFGLEYACRLSNNGVFYLLPSFRGEQPDTTHLCQFYHCESEIIGSLEDVICLSEDYVKHVINTVCDSLITDLIKICGLPHIEKILSTPNRFPRINLSDAILLLGPEDFSFNETSNGAYRCLLRSGELKLIKIFNGPVWLLYPDHLSVPFYQAFTDGSKKIAKAADLLAGVGEILGAGERHTFGASLREALSIHAVDPNPYNWYVTLKEEHPLQTAGFGMGIERLLCWILNHNDIRDLELMRRVNGTQCIP